MNTHRHPAIPSAPRAAALALTFVAVALPAGAATPTMTAPTSAPAATPKARWLRRHGRMPVDFVRGCVDVLMQHGTDRYGPKHTPLLVSILDVETRICPPNPLPLDEAWRVTRRGRRNPAGANLLTDQPLLRTLFLLSAATGEKRYARFARQNIAYALRHLVDEKGLFWWGWHRHYDVYTDRMTGHAGNHHEIHAIHAIDWPALHAVDPAAVRREIEALWRWHVIDKATGEINRHDDGRPGCAFSMSAGAVIEAFAFLHKQTKDRTWLDRARLVADYFWKHRDPRTNLCPDNPRAGRNRFDGSVFVTAVAGLHCHSLLKACELTGDATFRDYAVAYLAAYAKYGYDQRTRTFWGALRLDGTPVPGPRLPDGYAKYEPRGHLDLWEPYVAGYQFAIYTAQAYAHAYALTGEPAMLAAAERFADWIARTPTTAAETPNTWYAAYTRGPGRKGTHAGKYGRAVSFFLHLYVLSGKAAHLAAACRLASEAVDKLHHNALFRGHPAKPYYEAIDGVGHLLVALLTLDRILRNPAAARAARAVSIGPDGKETPLPLDNW